MTVWIVMRNGKVDEVFDNQAAALARRDVLNSLWAVTEILKKEVKSSWV